LPVACQHGNGSDWWVVTPERSTSKYHLNHIDEFGAVKTQIQDVGYNYPCTICDAYGINSFSPDGKTYVRYNNPWSFRVLNSMGQEVSHSVVPPYAYLHHVACDAWPPGIYYYQLVNGKGWQVATGRLVNVE